jgi:inosine-uridine nucleoside N-ribohydrolase
VTHELRLNAAQIRQRLQADRQPVLRDMVDAWLQKAPGITFHDPLAAATLFDGQICQFERGTVDVELASERLRGFTYWAPGGQGARHEIATDVDRTRFFEHYFAVLRGT